MAMGSRAMDSLVLPDVSSSRSLQASAEQAAMNIIALMTKLGMHIAYSKERSARAKGAN
jgi:hypothetical protein